MLSQNTEAEVQISRDLYKQNMAQVVYAMEAQADKDFIFVQPSGELLRVSYPELSLSAQKLALHLQKCGMREGETLAIVSDTPQDVVETVLACFVLNVVPVVLHIPRFAAEDELFSKKITNMLKTAKVKMFALSEEYVNPVKALSNDYFKNNHSIEDNLILLSTLPKTNDLLPNPKIRTINVNSEGIALFQFTSGSTSTPKCVALTHKNLLANAKAILRDTIQITKSDRAVSWLPLYHDMGLIGHVIAPICEGLSVTLAPTMAFLKRPSRWMQWVSDTRGTISFAPNFAFGLATTKKENPNLDLSCLRVLGCGSEPINPDTLRKFADSYSNVGLSSKALMPCYGLAEHTLAASFSEIESPMKVERICIDTYEKEQYAKLIHDENTGKAVVSCGKPFQNHNIKIIDPETNLELDDRQIGEIVLRGDSVSKCYFNNEKETHKRFTAIGYKTGDLGYKANGEIYITGRIKDLIILFGRNIDPQQIEEVVEYHPSVRRGSAYAFSIDGEHSEKLVVLFETKDKEKQQITKDIHKEIWQKLDLNAADVLALKPQTLPKTSSGKKQRRLAKDLYLKNQLC